MWYIERTINHTIIKYKYPDGFECIRKLDELNRIIYYKDLYREEWFEYDFFNNIIHYKNSKGFEYYKTYGISGITSYKDSNGVSL